VSLCLNVRLPYYIWNVLTDFLETWYEYPVTGGHSIFVHFNLLPSVINVSVMYLRILLIEHSTYMDACFINVRIVSKLFSFATQIISNMFLS